MWYSVSGADTKWKFASPISVDMKPIRDTDEYIHSQDICFTLLDAYWFTDIFRINV